MATAGNIKAERQARREYVHDRQKMVLRATFVFLTVCLILAVLGVTGVFRRSGADSVADLSNNFRTTAPCAPSKSVYPSASQVTVRVLNGTDKTGIATAVASALTNRGLTVQGASDSQLVLKRTEIRAGVNALPQAYFVLHQFNDAILRMDDRADQLVDVIVGSSFYDLDKSSRSNVEAGSLIHSISGCVAPDKIKNLPKAPEHEAVNTNPNETLKTS